MLALQSSSEGTDTLGRGAAHHGGVVLAQELEQAAKRHAVLHGLLRRLAQALVRGREEAARRHAGGEPVAASEALHDGEDALHDGVGGQGVDHVVRRLDSLVSDDRLLHGGQRAQELHQADGTVAAPDKGDEHAELLGHGQKNLVVVLDMLDEERHELVHGVVGAEGTSNHIQAAHRLDADLGLLVAHLVVQKAQCLGAGNGCHSVG
mmetsp:Transcript_19126/g.73143  ORF Transcript_19126/g.73143 Transcript_19126/m.73143 type:complete len:207 (-) Transcript_19126:58-678(-)